MDMVEVGRSSESEEESMGSLESDGNIEQSYIAIKKQLPRAVGIFNNIFQQHHPVLNLGENHTLEMILDEAEKKVGHTDYGSTLNL